MVEFFLANYSKEKNISERTIQNAYKRSAKNNQPEITKLFIKFGANDWIPNKEVFDEYFNHENIIMLELLLKLID